MSVDLAVQHKEARSLILALRERVEQLEKAERVRIGEARVCCVRSAHRCLVLLTQRTFKAALQSSVLSACLSYA